MPHHHADRPTPRVRASWRARLLRAAAPTLALAFAQPACFTMLTWQDNRARPIEAAAAAPELVAHRTPDASGTFAVQVPPTLMAHYAERDARLAANASWLLVEPRQHASTVAALLAMASANGFAFADNEVRRQHHVHLPLDLVLDERSIGHREWRLRCQLWLSSPGYQSVSRLPGFRKHTLIYTRYVFDVPCTVKALTSPPALGETLPTVSVRHELPAEGSHQTIARVLWTPVALAGDVLCAPWELLWWITP